MGLCTTRAPGDGAGSPRPVEPDQCAPGEPGRHPGGQAFRARALRAENVFLVDASIGDNIAYGHSRATQEQIEWAARTTQIHEFIRSLPLGYGTPVGERGVHLSGGQKQRIALARVLLTDPRILILDEPTSSVDAETERRDAPLFPCSSLLNPFSSQHSEETCLTPRMLRRRRQATPSVLPTAPTLPGRTSSIC